MRLSLHLPGLELDLWPAGFLRASGCPRGEEQQHQQGRQRGRPNADLDGVAHALQERRPGGVEQAMAVWPQPGGDGGGGADRVAGGLGERWRRAPEGGLDGRAVAGREDAAEHGHAQRPADLAGVSFMAEPTPALASGSEPMIDSVAGAMVKPMPAPSRASVAATRP